MKQAVIERLRADLEGLKEQGLYKSERVLAGPQGGVVRTGDRDVVNLCANNYLGLANHPSIREAAHRAIDRFGYGMASVRFICGTHRVHKQLEERLSRFLGTEDTILYSSCFDANGGLFETLLDEQDAVVSDALNHASIIDGIRLCKAQRYRYKNNDLADLETKLREAAELVNDGGKIRKRRTEWEKKLQDATGGDLFIFLVLRWTGLRGGDAIGLRWKDVRFDRGTNGEIELLTQKRSKIAIIPLSTELRNVLEEAHSKRKPRPEDPVLLNPENGQPFISRKRLYERVKALGIRAGVNRVTPHCFRDTFCADMLARGASIYDVAKMVADTVDTIEKHYAQFVPAARDAAQHKMDHGTGIEERAKLNETRGRKVAVFPARAK